MLPYLSDIPNYDDELQRLNSLEGFNVSQYLEKMLNALFDINMTSMQWMIVKWVLWTLLAVVIIWLIYKELILPELRYRKAEVADYSPQVGTMGTAADADIRGHNFNDELNAALEKGDYALAVNLQYLMALHGLDKQRTIRWKEWKTPMMYVEEIEQGKDELRRLTLSFLYIKYGHYPANKEVYDEALALYNSLIDKAKGGQP